MEDKKTQSENTHSMEPDPDKLVFTLSPVEKIPRMKPKKKISKYDIILDTFMKSKDTLFEISLEVKNVYYVHSQLKKRIEARKLKKISVFLLNHQLFLEKV